MKKLQLQNFGVREMDAEELVEIIGGSWFTRNFEEIGMVFVAVVGSILYLIKR